MINLIKRKTMKNNNGSAKCNQSSENSCGVGYYDRWNTWKSVLEDPPPVGVAVQTKILDHNGERNVQPLKLIGGLWFVPDGTDYVYYQPTHWRHLA
jgi:hypothetical protein